MKSNIFFTKYKIDQVFAGNRAYKSQTEWIEFFNKEKKAMISAPDVYKAPDFILRNLRGEPIKYWLVTSTRICYNPNDLEARIIHDFRSTVVKPLDKSVVVPVYSYELIEKVVKGEGLKFLQVLFGTEDDASKLIKRLETINKREAKEIKVCTPQQKFRKTFSFNCIGFAYFTDAFYIDSGHKIIRSDGGVSYGVSVSSA